jgi:hypothetical protein
MISLFAQAAGPNFLSSLSRELQGAFWAYPQVMAAVGAMGVAAFLVSAYWIVRGLGQAASNAQIAIRAQALRRQKDHRAMILIGHIDGPGGSKLREAIRGAIAQHFGAFAFQAPVQAEYFPVGLKVLSPRAHTERRRRLAVQALDMLERAGGDVIVWGKRNWLGKVELRVAAAPLYGRQPDMHAVSFRWGSSESFDGLDQAVTYACARRARPVLNRPQDYKPEKLQPIVLALEKLVNDPPASLNDATQLEILSDFASGALSLGERGGEARWLERALEARKMFLDKVDRTADPGAWGSAQQEVGRALAALGEREADRMKLEEAVLTLKQSLDALRATESLQAAEVAMRALNRAEQTLQQRKRLNLRWPV